ncbi:hypothetical protein SZN_37596, partial [Streptomyces zinciresistens K42]
MGSRTGGVSASPVALTVEGVLDGSVDALGDGDALDSDSDADGVGDGLSGADPDTDGVADAGGLAAAGV